MKTFLSISLFLSLGFWNSAIASDPQEEPTTKFRFQSIGTGEEERTNPYARAKICLSWQNSDKGFEQDETDEDLAKRLCLDNLLNQIYLRAAEEKEKISPATAFIELEKNKAALQKNTKNLLPPLITNNPAATNPAAENLFTALTGKLKQPLEDLARFHKDLEYAATYQTPLKPDLYDSAYRADRILTHFFNPYDPLPLVNEKTQKNDKEFSLAVTPYVFCQGSTYNLYRGEKGDPFGILPQELIFVILSFMQGNNPPEAVRKYWAVSKGWTTLTNSYYFEYSLSASTPAARIKLEGPYAPRWKFDFKKKNISPFIATNAIRIESLENKEKVSLALTRHEAHLYVLFYNTSLRSILFQSIQGIDFLFKRVNPSSLKWNTEINAFSDQDKEPFVRPFVDWLTDEPQCKDIHKLKNILLRGFKDLGKLKENLEEFEKVRFLLKAARLEDDLYMKIYPGFTDIFKSSLRNKYASIFDSSRKEDALLKKKLLNNLMASTAPEVTRLIDETLWENRPYTQIIQLLPTLKPTDMKDQSPENLAKKLRYYIVYTQLLASGSSLLPNPEDSNILQDITETLAGFKDLGDFPGKNNLLTAYKNLYPEMLTKDVAHATRSAHSSLPSPAYSYSSQSKEPLKKALNWLEEESQIQDMIELRNILSKEIVSFEDIKKIQNFKYLLKAARLENDVHHNRYSVDFARFFTSALREKHQSAFNSSGEELSDLSEKLLNNLVKSKYWEVGEIIDTTLWENSLYKQLSQLLPTLKPTDMIDQSPENLMGKLLYYVTYAELAAYKHAISNDAEDSRVVEDIEKILAGFKDLADFPGKETLLTAYKNLYILMLEKGLVHTKRQATLFAGSHSTEFIPPCLKLAMALLNNDQHDEARLMLDQENPEMELTLTKALQTTITGPSSDFQRSQLFNLLGSHYANSIQFKPSTGSSHDCNLSMVAFAFLHAGNLEECLKFLHKTEKYYQKINSKKDITALFYQAYIWAALGQEEKSIEKFTNIYSHGALCAGSWSYFHTFPFIGVADVDKISAGLQSKEQKKTLYETYKKDALRFSSIGQIVSS